MNTDETPVEGELRLRHWEYRDDSGGVYIRFTRPVVYEEDDAVGRAIKAFCVALASPSPAAPVESPKAWREVLREIIRDADDGKNGLHANEIDALEAALAADNLARRAESNAAAWHRQCEVIATILGLPEPEIGFPELVRAKFEAAEAQVAGLREALAEIEAAAARRRADDTFAAVWGRLRTIADRAARALNEAGS